MSNAEILNKVIYVFSNITDAEGMTEESDLLDDLGLSSMDVLMSVSALEEEFQVRIPEKKMRAVITIGDIADLMDDLIG